MNADSVFVLVMGIGFPLLVLVWRALVVIYQMDAKYNKLLSLSEVVYERGVELRLHALETEAWWYTWYIPSYKCDAAGYCTRANRALCDLFGLAEADMLGTGWAAAITDTAGKAEALHVWLESRERDQPYRDSYEAVNEGLAKYHHDAIVIWADANLE